MQPGELIFLSEADVSRVALSDLEILATVEDGLRAQGLGAARLEPRVHLEPDPAVPAALGLDGSGVGVVLRPPADVALYHRFENPLFDELLADLGNRDDVRAVVLPRTPEQADRIRALSLETFPRAALSRGLAGVRKKTLIINLPGSPGGVPRRILSTK